MANWSLAAIPSIQPIKNNDLSRIASGFGMRTDPFDKSRKMHKGMDFSAPRNTPVYAASNGKNIPADLVVSATGVKPNIGFLDGTDIKTDLGILVNRQMQTNDPHIYAAGDVAQGKDFSSEEFSVQAIQPTAVEHGQLAAKNMFGILFEYVCGASL